MEKSTTIFKVNNYGSIPFAVFSLLFKEFEMENFKYYRGSVPLDLLILEFQRPGPKWPFLSQGRWRNPKGEKQLCTCDIPNSVWQGAKSCSWIIRWNSRENFHLPYKTPHDENVSKKIQGSNLNSRSPFLPLQSWPTSGFKFRRTNSLFQKGTTQNIWCWWDALNHQQCLIIYSKGWMVILQITHWTIRPTLVSVHF